jgi:hypothetical protein
LWWSNAAWYGLKESPKAWEETRDKTLTEVHVTVKGKKYWLQQSVTHASIWLIMTEPQIDGDTIIEHASYGVLPFTATGKGTVVGVMGVYVDDLMVVADLIVVQTILHTIRNIWDTTEPEILGVGGCRRITYLGVTLEVDQEPWESVERLYVHQADYAHMVVDKFEEGRPLAPESIPGSALHHNATDRSKKSKEDEINIKFCQRALGSLLWLVTRTRPDMAWSYSVAASMTTRMPQEAAARTRHLLGYLKQARGVGLVFRRPQQGYHRVDIYADASFAPAGGPSHDGGAVAYVAGCPVLWKSR